jgi:hypothetical protein
VANKPSSFSGASGSSTQPSSSLSITSIAVLPAPLSSSPPVNCIALRSEGSPAGGVVTCASPADPDDDVNKTAVC